MLIYVSTGFGCATVVSLAWKYKTLLANRQNASEFKNCLDLQIFFEFPLMPIATASAKI